MKAKGYAQRFEAAPPESKREVLAGILQDFWKETNYLLEARKISTDRGLFTLLKEMDGKYRLFVSWVNRFQPILDKKGYRTLVFRLRPELPPNLFDRP